MPIVVGGRIKIILRWEQAAQKCEVVQWYRTDGAAFLTADMDGVLEAYWNDIKTVWRAMIVDFPFFKFTELVGAEENPAGAFGSYSIPLAEQQGTRAATGLGNFLPSFAAAGVRLNVATRVTRPGSKRLPGVMEGDNDNGTLDAGFVALADNTAEVYSVGRILGAPVATGVLHPIICRLGGSPAVPVASQDVTGHQVNQYITSQVSRKIGHGS
jgi:hypothetical protein